MPRVTDSNTTPPFKAREGDDLYKVIVFSCIFIDIFVKKKRDKIIDIYKINSYFKK